MNLAELLIGILILAAAVAFGLPFSKSKMSGLSRTNLLLMTIVGLLGFFAYQLARSENRAAVETRDYSRCWTDSCKSEVAAGAAERLSSGVEESLTDPALMNEIEMDFSNSLNQAE